MTFRERLGASYDPCEGSRILAQRCSGGPDGEPVPAATDGAVSVSLVSQAAVLQAAEPASPEHTIEAAA